MESLNLVLQQKELPDEDRAVLVGKTARMNDLFSLLADDDDAKSLCPREVALLRDSLVLAKTDPESVPAHQREQLEQWFPVLYRFGHIGGFGI